MIVKLPRDIYDIKKSQHHGLLSRIKVLKINFIFKYFSFYEKKNKVMSNFNFLLRIVFFYLEMISISEIS